jgi:hypothetical protein
VLKPVKPTIMAMQPVLFPHDKLHDDKAEKDEEITGNVVFAFWGILPVFLIFICYRKESKRTPPPLGGRPDSI